MNKAILKTECGPWARIQHLFPSGIPVYGTQPILDTPHNIPCYEIRTEELRFEQWTELAHRYMWQHEHEACSFHDAMKAISRRCTIPAHWISHVVVIGDITVKSEE